MTRIKTSLLTILLIFTNVSVAQKFSYFPLNAGNKWFFSQGLDKVIKLKLEIQKDTVLDDGYTYAKFNMYKVNSDSSFSLSQEGYSFLRKENKNIIEYPDRLIFDYDINIGDSVVSFSNEPYPAVLDTIVIENVFGRELNTYIFSFTQFDYYTYTDSIGFNTLWATTWHNWVPEYLLGCEIDGFIYGNIITGVENQKDLLTEFFLSQNYPNPFNPNTKIQYSLSKSGNTKIYIYDVLGREIMKLVDEYKVAGSYEVEFNAEHLSNGIYFYKIVSGDYSETKKMVLLK